MYDTKIVLSLYKKSIMKLNVGRPVTGDELVGRDNEVALILKTLKAGQGVALIAPRRFGKTSILLEVLQQLEKDGFYTGNIDIFTIPDVSQLSFELTRQVLKNRKLDEAFYKFRNNLAEILQNIKFRNEIQDAEFILSFGKPDKNKWEQLKNSLDYIDSFSRKHKKESCFAFDEFGDINKLDGEDIVKLFRSIVQNQRNTVYIFTGSYESVMNRLFVSDKSPFYRMVRIVEPGFLQADVSNTFIKRKFEILEIPVIKDHITKGVKFTKGHPYYVRLFIQEYFFQYKDLQREPEILSVFEDMFITEKNYIEKVWDEISSKKELRYVMLKIISSGGKPYISSDNNSFNISRAIKELRGKGLISAGVNTYMLTDPLLEFYLKRNVLKLDIDKRFLES